MEYLSSQLLCCFVLASSMFFISKGSIIYFPPYFTQEPTDTIAQKNKPLVLDCKVKGNPKPTIKWYRNGEELVADDRRSILPDGSLYFKSIVHVKGNRPDEGLYQCKASSQLRSQSYVVASRTIKLSVAGISSRVYIKPSSVTVYYGDMARIMCKIRHSIPKADFKWTYRYKNGTTETLSPGRKHTMLDNGVLQIASIKWIDDGQYSCTVHNKIAQKTHSSAFMILTVIADQGLTRRPDFIAKPQDTNATVGSNVVLECASIGRPTPKVQWYKDGVLLSYDTRVKLHGISNLMITNVTNSDEGVYECKIFSDSLSKEASAKLNIHYPPSFLTKPKNKNAHVSSDVEFKCVASGKPMPTISWLKNGDPCVPSDFIIISNTSLKVESVLTLDTGIYQCVAKNYLAEIQSSGELAVFEKNIPLPTSEPAPTTEAPTTEAPTTAPTTITTQSPTTTASTAQVTSPSITSPPGKPENLKARPLSETEIELSWDPPLYTGGKILKYTIYISFNTGSGASTDRRTAKGNQNILVIPNLKEDTAYKFIMFAENKVGYGQLAEVKARTASKNRPGVPLSLAAIGLSSSQIKVQWQEPTTGSAVKDYVIEYQQISDEVNYTKYSTIASGKQETLKNLKTYTSYRIWVYSVDRDGHRSHPAVTVAKTMGGVPKGKPSDVRVIGDGSGTALIVTWKPPAFDLVNGAITKYLLEYRKQDQQSTTRIDVQGDLLNYKLLNLDSNSVYEIRLAAGNPSGYGDYSLWRQANTSITKCSEKRSPGQPTEVEVSSPVKGLIRVKWQPPIDVSLWCVTGYRIAYGVGAPFPFKDDVNASIREHFIREGISPGREYVIKVEAVNSKDINGPNVQKTIKIPSGVIVIRKPVKNVRAMALSSNSVKVSWMEYSSRKPYLYHVYRSLQKTVVYCGNTTQLSITCTGLEPYTFYTFIVRRLYENTNATATNRTLEAKPSPPLDITGRLSEDNSSDLILSWQIPDKVNGKIIKYRIFYTTNTSLPTRMWNKKDIPGNTLNTRITDLERGVKYYFKIKTQNGAAWSDVSKTAMVPTYDTTKNPGKDNGGEGNINAQAGPAAGLKDKTLWIVIAAVAGVTLIAIIIISVILCKKRSGEDSSPRKPPPTYKAAVMANGSSRRKHKEDKKPDLWINQSDNVEMRPLMNNNPGNTNIPRSSTEMKPLDDHPIDKIKLDHERSSFRKGSQDVVDDLPPPPPQLLGQDDEDDMDAPSPIAIPSYSTHKPVVSYPRHVAPDDGTAQLSYPDYPMTSTPRHMNGMPRSESFDNTHEPNHATPLLRSHSDDIDHQTPIYAVPKPRNKHRPSNEEQRYQKPVVAPLPKPYIGDTPVGYSVPNGITRTKSADTRDVVADLDSQLAGLEGLMKDLNDITSRELLT